MSFKSTILMAVIFGVLFVSALQAEEYPQLLGVYDVKTNQYWTPDGKIAPAPEFTKKTQEAIKSDRSFSNPRAIYFKIGKQNSTVISNDSLFGDAFQYTKNGVLYFFFCIQQKGIGCQRILKDGDIVVMVFECIEPVKKLTYQIKIATKPAETATVPFELGGNTNFICIFPEKSFLALSYTLSKPGNTMQLTRVMHFAEDVYNASFDVVAKDGQDPKLLEGNGRGGSTDGFKIEQTVYEYQNPAAIKGFMIKAHKYDKLLTYQNIPFEPCEKSEYKFESRNINTDILPISRYCGDFNFGLGKIRNLSKTPGWFPVVNMPKSDASKSIDSEPKKVVEEK